MMKDYRKRKKLILERSKLLSLRSKHQRKRFCVRCGEYRYMGTIRGTVCFYCMDKRSRAKHFGEGKKR